MSGGNGAPGMPAEITVGEALNLALHDALDADPNVFLLGEDIGDEQGGGILGVTRGLSTTFGKARVRATPISEQAIIGAGIGAALAGFRPVAEIMLMNFVTVAMDMLVNHAAKLRFMSGGQTGVPLVVRTMTGSGFGNGGQHSDYLEAWFAHVPGMKVVSYSNPADAYGLLLASIRDDDPTLFIENLGSYALKGPAPQRGVPTPLGKAAIVRPGDDVTIISYSTMVLRALAAADSLARQNISCEVIDLRTIAPYDLPTLVASVGRTRRAVIVHEAVKRFGVGAEIAADLAGRFHGELKAPIVRLGGNYSAVPFSKPLESAYAPGTKQIEEAVLAMIAEHSDGL